MSVNPQESLLSYKWCRGNNDPVVRHCSDLEPLEGQGHLRHGTELDAGKSQPACLPAAPEPAAHSRSNDPGFFRQAVTFRHVLATQMAGVK